jgi:signal transduction histidine kinase
VRQAVLSRGTRADEVQSGQGIGLSVVAELVALYGGRLKIAESDLGGARVELVLP